MMLMRCGLAGVKQRGVILMQAVCLQNSGVGGVIIMKTACVVLDLRDPIENSWNA